MYTPASFAEHRTEKLHAFMRQHPFATIVTCDSEGLEATHVPVVLHSDVGRNGVMRCHVARANSQWKRVRSGCPVLVIFQGPEHYISPSWYPAKAEHGKVVPTWNYVAVHVRGQANFFEDRDLLIEHLKTLTMQNEAAFEKPWSVDDAPRDYVDGLTKAIMGIEISIDSIEGKWKVSQNRSDSDRQGVIAGLRRINSPKSIEMLRLVDENR